MARDLGQLAGEVHRESAELARPGACPARKLRRCDMRYLAVRCVPEWQCGNSTAVGVVLGLWSARCGRDAGQKQGRCEPDEADDGQYRHRQPVRPLGGGGDAGDDDGAGDGRTQG